MKKYLLALFCVMLLFVVTGCGSKNQVKCTGTQTESGITIKGEVIADLDNDNKITDATVVYDLGDKTTADQYCALFKLMENADKGVSVSCSGSKITIKGYANMESEDDDDDVLLGATKEEFIKAMEKENFTCK